MRCSDLILSTFQASQLLQRVLAYESSYDDLQGWLRGEKARAASFSPPAITVEELKAQLQEVEVRRGGFSVGSSINNERLSVYQLYFGKKLCRHFD